MKYDPELYRIKADICKHLADPKRQMIISELHDCEKTVCDIAEGVGITQPAASHHLNILYEGGVVNRRREGSNTYYRLSDPKITEACEIIQTILMDRAKRYQGFVDKMLV